MLDNGAVPSTLKDKLDKYSSTIPKIPSIEVGIETLEGIYNRRSAKRMYLHYLNKSDWRDAYA